MESKGIITVAVTVTVAVIVLAGILMPVLDDSTATTDTFTNNGVYYMTDDDTSYILEYKGVSGDFVVNGETVCNRADIPNGSWTFISTPQHMVRLQNWGSQNYVLMLISMDGTYSNVGNNTGNSSVTVTNNTIQVNSSDPVSYDGEFRAFAKTGNYVMSAGGTPFTVSDTDTIIIGNGTTSIDHWYDLFYISGTVDDINISSADGITVSNITVNSTPLANYIDGSIVSSITFTATGSGDPVNATYDRVIVPHEVTLERATHLTDSQNVLLAVIPILIIVAILMGVAAVVLRSRY